MKRSYNEILVERITSLVKAKGISINGLASMSGLRQSTVDSILKRRSNNPKIQTLHKIAIALNMTLAEFFDFPELNEYSFEEDNSEQSA